MEERKDKLAIGTAPNISNVEIAKLIHDVDALDSGIVLVDDKNVSDIKNEFNIIIDNINDIELHKRLNQYSTTRGSNYTPPRKKRKKKYKR